MDRYYELRKNGTKDAWHLIECQRYEDEELNSDELLTILTTCDLINISRMIDNKLRNVLL